MKTSAFIPHFRRNAASALLLTLLASPAALAQDASKNFINQNRADQTDVRQHTAALGDQIQGLIDELANNGISGDDIKVLQTTKTVLNNLSAQEMDKVIASLQKAAESAGTKEGEKNLVDAYAGQTGIINVFREILKDYEQRQAADELPAKFKELTDRQTQVMWTTAQVATDIAGKSQSELDTMQQTTAQIVQTDQNALVNDVASAKAMLDKAAKDSTGDQGRAMQQAQQDLQNGKLQDALDKANADLTAGHLLQATTEQKLARDQLRQLTKDLNPPASTAEALSDFAATLSKLIEEQKGLLDQTTAAVNVTPRMTGLDTKEGVLVDQANSLQEDMLSMAPVASGLVKDAITPMQMSRAYLGPRGQPFDKAEASEQDAIAKLEDAQKALNQQVADAEKAEADAAKDSTEKLQDLQKQIQQAMQQQQQTSQQTANANATSPPDTNQLAQDQQAQSALQQQATAMQQTAAPLSLAASQALANAASDMSQAQQAMSDPANAQAAQSAQQSAQQALQQANQAVAQQIAQNQQQATDPSQLAQAASDLQQAQSDVSNAIADSTPQQSSSSQDSSQSASQQGASQQATPPSMAQAQAALAQAAQATQAAAATPGLPDSAAAAVGDAEKSIAQGQQDAAQGDAPGTAAAAAAAQASLAQAQAAVSVAQAGMTPGPPGPGGPPTPGGPPMPNAPPGIASNAMMPPGPDQKSLTGAKNISGGSTDKGTLHGVSGNGKFLSVQNRERAAITETQGENRPQEYAPMIDQYMKNLSDQDTSSSQ
jgi:hypothetical protein